MKRLIIALLALAATAALAEDVPAQKPLDAKFDRVLRASTMRCKEMTVSQTDSPMSLPAPFTSVLIKIDSPRGACDTQTILVTSRLGGIYVGVPWLIKDAEGKTIEEKLKNFAWQSLHLNLTPEIDRSGLTADGLYRVTMVQTTEAGKMPLQGEVDPQGTVFFMGHFRRASEDTNAVRLKTLEPFIAAAPQEGATKPAVTVIEFSDFECPSCQHAATYMNPIMAKYSEQVKYVRYDMPLVQMHPWALSAAVAGRAIYKQKPAAFWEYKKAVYENQEKLSAFMIDDFARNFAKDHELDLTKYDADVNGAELRSDVLKAAGAALTNDVRSTPTYMVNGEFVDAGENGKGLEEIVASLLKK